ncbi:diaminopimelate epimerase [Cytophagaceae bacterium 50C-KIRBA]|uniref:Diaminopimelate epimerase n=1 Tax=Aquirufa beregesia TaxID=2516556 RepID=A0ABX0EYP2_9BACT|nr:diaminopimelate epimerase [Aquirufa beregesia]NGZ45178.1 diaminopimelate epimerase [Aquirufa beregesia]
MKFYKYQGTGNDFVIIDDREGTFHLGQKEIAHLCHRRFGIGADGLMLLQKAEGYDFRMVYYNSDGTEGSMCGNGGRCLVRFAADLSIVQDFTTFIAIDGEHQAHIDPDKISLHMQNVAEIESVSSDYFAQTGSPHLVRFTSQVQSEDVKQTGAQIRYSDTFKSRGGTNVNFVELLQQGLFVRTYERGVEDETYSCGTGVTAAALVANAIHGLTSPVAIQTIGGNLSIEFKGNAQTGFYDVYLIGPAVRVFEGEITSL